MQSTSDQEKYPELIADYLCEVGENPLWHPMERKLYWTDIPNGRLFRYDPASGCHEPCYNGRPVGGFTIQADGSLLLFMDRGSIAIWRDGVIHNIVPELAEERTSRFNDVIADPRGRVFCGTMSNNQRKGRLYRLDLDGSCHVLLENIGCSNGMAFTLDRKHLYYTDSFERKIYLFDYSERDGSISNRRVFASMEEPDGMPDGATIDAEGYLWSAIWDGGCILRFRPDGTIHQRIAMPTRKVSSVIFGGENYTDLYITTAGGNTKTQDGPLAGGLFRWKAPISGLAEFFSRIQL